MNDAVTKVMTLIDDEGDPKNMTKAEWVIFLEEIIAECESRAAAAREEIADDE